MKIIGKIPGTEIHEEWVVAVFEESDFNQTCWRCDAPIMVGDCFSYNPSSDPTKISFPWCKKCDKEASECSHLPGQAGPKVWSLYKKYARLKRLESIKQVLTSEKQELN